MNKTNKSLIINYNILNLFKQTGNIVFSKLKSSWSGILLSAKRSATAPFSLGFLVAKAAFLLALQFEKFGHAKRYKESILFGKRFLKHKLKFINS